MPISQRRPWIVLFAALVAGTPLNPVVAQQPAGGSPRFEAWGIAYAVPSGWSISQQQGRVHTLTSSTNDQVVYVAPGLYQSFDEVASELPKAFQLLGLRGMPSGQPQSATVNGLRTMTAEYVAQDQSGMPVQVRVAAVLTGQGSGLLAFGLARPSGAAALTPALAAVVQGVLANAAPTVNAQAVAALRGKWIFYNGRVSPTTSLSGGSSRSYEETVEFDGAGRFAWSSSASVSVTTPDAVGASAAGANGSSDAGSYTVIGTTLVVRGRQGMASFEIQVMGDHIIADGRTFIRGE